MQQANTATAARQPPPYEKEVVFAPETRDFVMYLDGELVGFARTYSEAEETLDALVYELLQGRKLYADA